jgi:uracil-DNA glycosylase
VAHFLCNQIIKKWLKSNLSKTYVTYILKRRPVRAYEKEQVRDICMMHLEQQIQQKKPKLIVCLGNVAAQSFFHKPEAEVKTLRGIWHNVQGYQTAVAYHPLAVRRRPNLWSMFLEDWTFVAERYQNLI